MKPQEPDKTPEPPIRFGIRSLDELLGRREPVLYEAGAPHDDARNGMCGVDISPVIVSDNANANDAQGRESLTMAIIGSDGTGKSVLAMHLAAYYLFDRLNQFAGESLPFRVIYTSTDLSFPRAQTTWQNFALGYPDSRIDNPFDITTREKRFKVCENSNGSERTLSDEATRKLQLMQIRPFQDSSPGLRSLHNATEKERHIHYLDLASYTSGDDWGYLNRLVASLRQPNDSEPLHLLVVDTVDDLELMVGERDSHGARRDRRSRLAELIRTASGKCHLLLLAGDQPIGQAPEEYIADVVIRARFRPQGEYVRRLICVEKVRGQSNIRGDHDFTIRSGVGASTGIQEHFDDPRIVRPDSRRADKRSVQNLLSGDLSIFRAKQEQDPCDNCNFPSPSKQEKDLHDKWDFQSYVHVFHSLHYVNNSIMRADGPSIQSKDSKKFYASFGIDYLDDMLARPSGDSASISGSRRGGIPTLEPTALIGEDGTHKSALAKAFLARAFLPAQHAVVETPPESPESDKPHGVAILVTTKTLDTNSLLERINDHLPQNYKYQNKNGVPDSRGDTYRSRLICRRLDYHHMTSSILYHVIVQAVRAAQRIIELQPDATEADRRNQGWKIRLVIDNWTTVQEMYPDVRNDPLFLPCLLFHLRREGIATLIVANEDRGFSDGFNLTRCRDLRDLTAVHLFTWRTPFSGQSRVAITSSPSVEHGRLDVIRELAMLPSANHVPDNNDEVIAVNPSFQLFVGITKGEPEYVPLRIYLYGENPKDAEYFTDAKAKLGWILKADPNSDIVRVESADDYERLREFSQLQGATRFPYTLVLQVDEYWAKTSRLQLTPILQYLTAVTAQTKIPEQGGLSAAITRNFLVEDPFGLFQPSRSDIASIKKGESEVKWDRIRLLTPPGYDLRTHVKEPNPSGKPKAIIKVPYTWDFGFLMCHADLWECAAKDEWARLRRITDCTHSESVTENCDWYGFVIACRKVAEFANRQFKEGRRYSTFALGAEVQGSLSCLLLEIWASEVEEDILKRKTHERDPDLRFNRCRHEAEPKQDLTGFAEQYKRQLYKALCLMYELIPHGLIGTENRLLAGQEAGAIPVAARTWYASAGDFQTFSKDDWYVPAALPGSYSVRGDWFLAIARGSRSYLMGERAIDLLCTRRANLVRIQTGVGLPVRDNCEQRIGLWTTLWNGDRRSSAVHRITYQQLASLGGPMNVDDAGEAVKSDGVQQRIEGGNLRWLWRSRIKNYDRHARVFRRWICWMLRRFRDEAKVETGIELFDKANVGSQPKWFDNEVRDLITTLHDATIESESAE